MRRETYLYRAALMMFALGAVGGAALLFLHRLMPDAIWPAPAVPAVFAGMSILLFFALRRWPAKLIPIARVAIWIGVLLQWIPAWLLISHAVSTDSRLLDGLPPVETAQLLLMMLAVAFLPRREGWKLAALSWLLLAVPLFVYLAFHTDELRELRGLQLIVTLGPLSAIALVLIPLFRGIDREVASLERDRTRMRELAERDALTGLYNRRAGETWLREAVSERPSGIGVVMFDIDRFKQINDRHGHAAGDDVLREIARRCQAVLRRDDVLVRWGGEEFLVLLRGADHAAMALMAEAMRNACRRTPIEPAGAVTASFGATLWRAGEAIDDCVGRADAAMYAAKADGRDRVVVNA